MSICRKTPRIFACNNSEIYQKWICRTNGVIAKKPKDAVDKNDLIEIEIPEKKAEKIDFPIIFEDENVIIINKPRGVLTHSKGALKMMNLQLQTSLKAVAQLCKGTNRVGIVHRLDRDFWCDYWRKNDEAAKNFKSNFLNEPQKRITLQLLRAF